ncbi:MAG: hypothetical protein M1416_01675 [Candidatus Pacearchaeota archaeon]|nr:hypothetical protein [Candidatus Pacearchaeota archaeon]
MAKETKKKKSVKEKKEKIEKEKVCEIFEVEKNGEEKIVKSCGIEEEKAPSENQIKKEYKTFKIIIITMLGFILMFLAVLWLINYLNNVNVGGVIFEIDRNAMAGKTLYRTSLPVKGGGMTGEVTADYNFWLRNDPRKLDENIPFQGVLRLRKENVINLEEDFNCEGYGIIAIANLLKLYQIIGGNVIKDENASCDLLGRYGYINILKGNETYIDKSGPACYNIYIKDCEILEGTERFMLEMFIETNKQIQ